MRQPLDTGLRLVTDYDDMLERERQRVNAMKLAIKFSTDERTDPLERRQGMHTARGSGICMQRALYVYVDWSTCTVRNTACGD